MAPLERAELKAVLRRCLAEGTIQLWYQPIFYGEAGDFPKAEALLRLPDGRGGVVMPNDFIPLAEENGSIVELGMLVLDRTLDFLSRTERVRISVNVSPRQLNTADFADRCLALIARKKADVSRLIFEITESGSYDFAGPAGAHMKKLAAAGIEFSLDDVGVGASDLRKLCTFPFRFMKLDKRYVWGMADSPGGGLLVKHLIRFARSRGMRVVAEGVETQDQARALGELGCDYQQGFLYSRPLPEGEYVQKFMRSFA